jgi:hypothetical protein
LQLESGVAQLGLAIEVDNRAGLAVLRATATEKNDNIACR